VNERRRTERRLGDDRRVVLARRRGSRRRETPTPFSMEQLEILREHFAHPAPVRCPACGSPFTLGEPRRRGTDTVRRVSCTGCGKAAVFTNTRAARILVVEAKGPIRDALYGVLAAAGHEVVEVADADVGLAAYQNGPADVVFLDVQAPGRMPAAEFVRRLLREYPEARIVAMAGRPSFSGVDPVAVTQGLGAVRTIRMPLAPADVLKIVEEVRP